MKQDESALESAYNDNGDMCTETENSPKMPRGQMGEVRSENTVSWFVKMKGHQSDMTGKRE
jgi:hypothetical protein